MAEHPRKRWSSRMLPEHRRRVLYVKAPVDTYTRVVDALFIVRRGTAGAAKARCAFC